MQPALTHSACFLGDAMAGEVAHRDDNFEANQLGVRERPVSNVAHRRSCHPSAPRTRSNPVTKIRALVDPIDLIQPTAPEIAPIRRRDGEFEGRAGVKRGNLNLQPRTRVVDRIPRVTPRHPRLEFIQRFTRGFRDLRVILQLISPDPANHSQQSRMSPRVQRTSPDMFPSGLRAFVGPEHGWRD